MLFSDVFSAGDRHAMKASISSRLVAGGFALVLLGAVIASTVSASVGASTTATVQRIFGQDAIETSIAVSRAEFSQSASARSVILARSDYFADALAGGPLAAANDGPLLITPGAAKSQTLDPRVRSEIQRVLPHGRTVFVLGGPLALASGIDDALHNLGYVVVRVQGANQFATAVAIAGQLGNPSVVFEATGLDFADALSAVPAAIQARGAILLTKGSAQAPETAAFLAAHPPTSRYAIGGPLAAAGADPLATAVYGQDLFETSAAVASRFFPDAETFGAATGLTFPDALSGGVFMGTPGRIGALLIVNAAAPLPSSIVTYLIGLTNGSNGYLFGGPLAVNDNVVTALDNPTLPPPSPPPTPGPQPTNPQGLVNQINAQRAANGRAPLATDGGLTNVAGGWAAHLAGIGVLQHQDLYTFLGSWNTVGETLEVGPCSQSDQAIVAAWMNSPPHRDILMSPAFSAVGVAAVCGADGREWVVADFGG